MAEQWIIDGEQLFEFLSDQLIKETGAFSKGVNKGLNIARSAIHNADAVKPIDPETIPIVRQLRAELARVTAERDAAVSDIETAMAYPNDNCRFCKNANCQSRNGTKPCLPKWRGPKKEE